MARSNGKSDFEAQPLDTGHELPTSDETEEVPVRAAESPKLET